MHRILFFVALVAAAAPARAQEDFGPIALKVGQRVQVVEDGVTLRGTSGRWRPPNSSSTRIG